MCMYLIFSGSLDPILSCYVFCVICQLIVISLGVLKYDAIRRPACIPDYWMYQNKQKIVNNHSVFLWICILRY